MRFQNALTVAVTTAVLVGLAGPSQAAPPKAQRGTIDLVGTATAGQLGFCAFPVRIDYVNNQKTKTSTGSDGSIVQRSTGFASATVTNTLTGASTSLIISGPGTTTTYLDGSFTIDAAGPNLLWTAVANSYPGVPQLAYTNGHVQVAVASSGLTTSYKLHGSSQDVCAALR